MSVTEVNKNSNNRRTVIQNVLYYMDMILSANKCINTTQKNDQHTVVIAVQSKTQVPSLLYRHLSHTTTPRSSPTTHTVSPGSVGLLNCRTVAPRMWPWPCRYWHQLSALEVEASALGLLLWVWEQVQQMAGKVWVCL